jgi:hypothetical protein
MSMDLFAKRGSATRDSATGAVYPARNKTYQALASSLGLDTHLKVIMVAHNGRLCNARQVRIQHGGLFLSKDRTRAMVFKAVFALSIQKGFGRGDGGVPTSAWIQREG